MGGQTHALTIFTPEETIPITHQREKWVSSRSILNKVVMRKEISIAL
jgi:hypothetical protein